MQDIRAYLLDLDGVVYRGERLLPGARDLVEWLDATGRKVLYLSNNSIATPQEVEAKLARLGMPSPEGRVLTAGQAAARALAARFPHGRIFVLGLLAVEQMMEQQGLQVVWSEHDDDRIPDALIVALDRNLTYDRLRRALGAILGGAAFYAVNRDPRLPVEDGFVPGTGSISAALEYASGQKATIIGKPEPDIVVQAMHMLGVSPTQTLMVGDGLDLDIVAGRAAGVTTALVLTGLTSGEEASRSTGTRRPHVVYKDLIDLLGTAKATARAASS